MGGKRKERKEGGKEWKGLGGEREGREREGKKKRSRPDEFRRRCYYRAYQAFLQRVRAG